MDDNLRQERAVGLGAAARAGAFAALAAGIFIAPFGALAGVISAESGFSLLQALAMSFIVYAGAAQLTIMELAGAGAPLAIIVISALALNLRFLLYSASLAPSFSHLPKGGKLAVALLTVDNTVSSLLAWRRFEAAGLRERLAYFLACGVPTLSIWLIFTGVGHQLGPLLDPKMLKFVAPVAFMSLAAPLLTSRPRWAAAIVAATAAVLLKGHAYHLDIILAALLGVGAGLLFAGPPTPGASEGEQSFEEQGP